MTRMSFGRACARICTIAALVASLLTVGPPDAQADRPVKPRISLTGKLGFAVTGAPLATDGGDADSNVDALALPAEATITATQVPDGARVRRAFLYWTGSFDQPAEGPCAGDGDDVVTFTTPDGSSHEITAQMRSCSDGSAASYDVRAYRTNVSRIVDDAVGTFTLDAFEPDIGNAASDNASFSVVIMFVHRSLPQSTVVLHDGLIEMSHREHTVGVDGVPVGPDPGADLAYYTVEGDPSTSGGESVEATALPSAATEVVSDASNPPDDPMNATINVSGRTDTTGVDVDRFSLSVLAPGDDALDVTFDSGSDKWWLVYAVVRVAPIELPKLKVRDAKVVEGDSGRVRMRFVVRLTEASAGPVTFSYLTRDRTATAPRDYRARSGDAEIQAGRLRRVLKVPVRGDTRIEPDEDFHLRLRRPRGAVFGDRLGVGTIVDDDR